MNLQQWIAVGALLSASLTAHAGQPTRTPDPANPSAEVPAIIYVSVLDGNTAAPLKTPTPDKLWRAANEVVGAQSNHAMHHQHVPAPAPTPVPMERKSEAQDQHQQHKHH